MSWTSYSRHHKNPHAHVIHKPGTRLMHHVPLKFVWNKVAGHGKRSPNAALNLVSFIDFLVATVIFLLSSFSASGEITVDKNVKLPKAENVEDVIDAPDGRRERQPDPRRRRRRPARPAPSRSSAACRRSTSSSTCSRASASSGSRSSPNKPFPGVCILQVDQDVPALVVKSVFQTAAFAGYPNVSFMVGKLPKSGGAPRVITPVADVGPPGPTPRPESASRRAPGRRKSRGTAVSRPFSRPARRAPRARRGGPRPSSGPTPASCSPSARILHWKWPTPRSSAPSRSSWPTSEASRRAGAALDPAAPADRGLDHRPRPETPGPRWSTARRSPSGISARAPGSTSACASRRRRRPRTSARARTTRCATASPPA